MFRSKQTVDPSDYEAVFMQHRKTLIKQAMRAVFFREDAEDIVQTTFLRSFVGWPTKNPDSPVRPWLLRIQANVINDFYTKESKRVVDGGIRHMLLAAVENNSDILDIESKVDIEGMLSKLTPEDAGILILKDDEGLSWSELAMVTGRSVGHLRQRYERAKANARKLLTN